MLQRLQPRRKASAGTPCAMCYGMSRAMSRVMHRAMNRDAMNRDAMNRQAMSSRRFHGKGTLVAAVLASFAFASGCSSDPPPEPLATLAELQQADVQLLRLWKSNVGEAGRGRFDAVLDGDLIYAANGKGRVSAYAADTGMRRWQRELDKKIVSGVGFGEGQLYVASTDGRIDALSADSGEPLWQQSSTSEVLAPPAARHGAVVVRSTNGQLRVLEPADGSERWSVSYSPPALTLNGYGLPLLVAQGVVVGLDDGNLVALGLDDGRSFWESSLAVPSGRSEVERMVDIDADVLDDNRAVYAVSYQGRLGRFEPARGSVQWSVPASSVAGFALGDSALYLVDENDRISAHDLDTGQLLWEQKALDGRRLGTPALADERLFVGDGGGILHVIDAADGKLRGRARVADEEEAITARPIVDDGVIYTFGRKGTLAAWRYADL
ncbi:MAG: outer membrane protein assembly factor BamB [Gammaproteobacteria bacterium]|nr:MAG: outer membrane protein assembly factor BamB [Gammaproteobacteria bacterium]PIE36324.1 MAG: outer membrane protein assembly factor BamB [Gammaproteobacteria bacterium]